MYNAVAATAVKSSNAATLEAPLSSDMTSFERRAHMLGVGSATHHLVVGQICGHESLLAQSLADSVGVVCRPRLV
jgi:molybdopterin biosynthesis enzyme